MTTSEIVQDIGQLTCKIEKFITQADTPRINFLAGHFPLRVNEYGMQPAYDEWGDFTLHSFEMSLMMGSFARFMHKQPKYMLLVDDHSYRMQDSHKLGRGSGSRRNNLWSRSRANFYRAASGPQAALDLMLAFLMSRYNCAPEDIIRHNHGKKGRESCLYLSESVLRDPKRHPDFEPLATACAQEYTTMLHLPGIRHIPLVSFIPTRCSESVGLAVERHAAREGNFPNMHVYMTSGVSVDDIYKQGVVVEVSQ